ncbi:MAG: signal peptidase I, partial [Burkholderiales bacterium RIFOXYC12_FULL_60_6]
SMVPTLLVGDFIFVNKMAYGIRIPILNKRLVVWNTPSHGEVIVFVFPNDPQKDYIKRVIGLPGDEVEISGHAVTVNGTKISSANPEPYLYDEDGGGFGSRRGLLYPTSWGGHVFHTFYTSQPSDDRFADGGRQGKVYKVSPDHLFVMGDNRDNSSDSRVWGEVPMENVKGRAMVIWWSSGDSGARFGRLFTPIF